MTHGLFLGKFMPLHEGHIALIQFAARQCDLLTVYLCFNDQTEPIPGKLRLQWLEETLGNSPGVEIRWTDVPLPYTPHSDKEISRIWSEHIRSVFPGLTHIFSSEPYGDYLAEYLSVQHISFDPQRQRHPVSAGMIRQYPLRYFSSMAPAARPWFLQRYCLYGAESTGKSMLSEKLAARLQTTYVPEMARTVIPDSKQCTWEDLEKAMQVHAEKIREREKMAHKILLLDTDIRVTEVYARYLFGKELRVTPAIREINRVHHYFLLAPDQPYLQDGTRLGESTRANLHRLFQKKLEDDQCAFTLIEGSWDEKMRKMEKFIRTDTLGLA